MPRAASEHRPAAAADCSDLQWRREPGGDLPSAVAEPSLPARAGLRREPGEGRGPLAVAASRLRSYADGSVTGHGQPAPNAVVSSARWSRCQPRLW